MSYDLLFYFPREPRSLPLPKRGAKSSVVVGRPVAVEAEDVCEEIRHLMSGGGFQLMVSCSGIREDDFEDLERIKTEINRDNAGVIVLDYQAGTVIIDGEERPLPQLTPARRSAVSIFFEDGPRFEAEQFEAFLGLVQHHIPKALPRRYGPDEPLQFKTAEQGLDHFKAQWRANPGLAWQPDAPFIWVSTAIRNDCREFPNGAPRRSAFAREYRCSRITLIAEEELCGKPKLLGKARNFVAEAALLVNAFYAEIRADYFQFNDRAWWWKGMPRDPPLIAIVGPPYCALWPGLDAISQPLADLHRLVSTKIAPTTDAIEMPEDLICPRDKTIVLDGGVFVRPNEDYARLFPFARPQ
jgi:hypothetical protein